MKIDFVQEINDLVFELHEGGEEIAPFVSVGVQVYKDLRKEMASKTHNPYAMQAGFVAMSVCTPYCTVDVKCDPSKPADYIGMNGRTILDIIAERELLGED